MNRADLNIRVDSRSRHSLITGLSRNCSQRPRSFKVHSACACALAVRPDLGSSTRRNMARATVKVQSKKLSRVKRNMYLRLFARAPFWTAYAACRCKCPRRPAKAPAARRAAPEQLAWSTWLFPTTARPQQRPVRRIEGREVS